MAGPELGPAAKIGPYEIVRRLGAGGMGAVYLGRHETAGTAAAVKLIRPEHTANPEFRARLRREVEAARRVPRFCTAPVLAADPDAEPPWLATEYIDGPTLDVALLERQRLTGSDLDQFAVSVAVALRAIHEHGVVHRDLKPSNILLSANGPRVIDFGIARIDDAGTLTATGVMLGTPAFMAPELLRSEPLTAAVDVFAWASVVTYAATGAHPFGRGQAALQAILDQEPDLSALGNPLRDLVAAAFHKDPARRPAASELVHRLSRSAAAVTTGVLSTAAAAPNQPAEPATPLPLAGPAGNAAHRVPPAPPPPGPTPAAPAPWPMAPVAGAASAWPAPPDPERARRRRRWAVAAGATAAGVAAVLVGVTAIVVLPRLLEPGGRAGANPSTGATPTASAPAPSPSPSPAATEDLPPLGTVIGERLTGHTGTVTGVALGSLPDETPIAVSGGWHGDRTVRVWDLTTMEQIGDPLTGHLGSVSSVAFGALADGTPIAVSGGTRDQVEDVWDHTVRVWDLDRMEQIGGPLQGHEDLVQSVAIGELDGTPIAVTGSLDGTVRVWNLSTMEQWGRPLTGHDQAVYAVALGERDGAPIAVSGSDDETVRVWDLDRLEQSGELTGHSGQILPVVLGDVGGTPVAVVASSQDPAVRVWNLDTMEQVGGTFDVHRGGIYALAMGELDGVPVAVSGGQDQTVRVWSLAAPELLRD